MDQASVLARLRKFEGCIPYMYRCTGGEVTIGIGHAIQSAADAAGLSWEIAGSAATGPAVQADWAKVAAAQKGMVATNYAGLTRCRMSAADIDQLAAADVQRFETQLAGALPTWNSYPGPAQEALFDMAFNLGLAGLKKFPALLAAVDAGLWETAAQQCHRKGIGDARNQETADLFRRAGQ